MSAPLHFKETRYGFEYGNAKIERAMSDLSKGWIVLTLETDKHKGNKHIQIYVTATGKVRIHDSRGEWKCPPNKSKKPK